VPLVPPQVRAVFFDAVGTLLLPDPPAPAAYAEVAARHGLALTAAEVRARFLAAYRAEEEADRAAGWVTSEARERGRWRRIVTTTLAGASDPEACYRLLFDHFARPSAWRLAPGAAEALAALEGRGLAPGLGSNYDDRLWPVLAGFPELNFARRRVLISADVGVRKPGAEFFRRCAAAAECELREVLFVGDDPGNDYEGASAAGMPALLLDPAGRYPEVPHRIASLAELAG
jgi:putative hydrolase of the HAD superfamily